MESAKPVSCDLTDKLVDDYVDGTLAVEEQLSYRAHLDACMPCRRAVEDTRVLRQRIREYSNDSAPSLDPAFVNRAMIRAVSDGRKQDRKRFMLAGGACAAAVLAVAWMLGGNADLSTGNETMADMQITDVSVPSVTMTLDEARVVNLVFASNSALDNATMHIALPAGVEVAGFAGQREITWITSLKAGNNILPLQLVASTTDGGSVLATLRHRGNDKTFQVQVSVI